MIIVHELVHERIMKAASSLNFNKRHRYIQDLAYSEYCLLIYKIHFYKRME